MSEEKQNKKYIINLEQRAIKFIILIFLVINAIFFGAGYLLCKLINFNQPKQITIPVDYKPIATDTTVTQTAQQKDEDIKELLKKNNTIEQSSNSAVTKKKSIDNSTTSKPNQNIVNNNNAKNNDSSSSAAANNNKNQKTVDNANTTTTKDKDKDKLKQNSSKKNNNDQTETKQTTKKTRFVIEIQTFNNLKDAEARKEILTARGINCFIKKIKIKKKIVYRLLIGEFQTKKDAEITGKNLENKGIIPKYIIREIQ